MRSIFFACTLLLLPAAAHADDKTKDTARAVAKTGADVVVDSARVVGDTAKGMWNGGQPGAKRAYDEAADRARRDLDRDRAETHAASHQ